MSSLCGPCCEAGSKKEASKWCAECREMLCIDCCGYHQSLRLTKTHHLVDAALKDNNEGPCQNLTPLICVQHPPLEYNFYCRQHDTVLCQTCMSTQHQQCGQDVMPIDSIASGTKVSPHFHHYEQEVPKLLQGFGNMMIDKQRVQREFVESTSDAKNRLGAIKFHLQKYIDELEQTEMANLNTKEAETCGKLLSEIQTIDGYQKEGAILMSELQTVQTSGTDRQAFILMQKLKSFFAEKGQKMKELSYNMQTFTLKADFVDPAILCRNIGHQLGSYQIVSVPFFQQLVGEMKISHSPQPPRVNPGGFVQPIPAISASPGRFVQPISATSATQLTHLDTKKFVQDITVMDDGTVVVVELNVMSSSRVYFFTESGQQVNEIKLPSSPTGIAAIPGTERVAVLVGEEKILFFDKLQYNPDLTDSETISMASGCNHIAASNSRLCVSNHNTIIAMDTHGKYIKTIKLSGEPVQSMCVNNNGDIFYALNDKLYCITEFGEELCLYFNKDLKEVSGLTLDANGNVYISGKKSKNIHVVRQSNGSSGILLRKENGLKKPRSLCFDQFRNKLYVDHNNYDPIQVFEVK